MQNWSEVLIPMAVMASFVVIVALVLNFQLRNKRLVMEAIRLSIEKNEAVNPLLVEAIARSARATGGDLRRGCILFALALAALVFGYLFGVLTNPRVGAAAMGLAAFPGFLGLAFIGFGLFERKRS